MRDHKIILIVLLSGIVIFSLFKYTLVLKEKHDLQVTLDQIREQVGILENEKSNLLQELEAGQRLNEKLREENSAVQAELKTSQERLVQLDAELMQTQKAIEDLNAQLSSLKAENTALMEEKDNLNNQIAQIIQEKDQLQARLNSLSELRKAIRELKRRMRYGGTLPGQEGNQGFLLKDGKSTYAPNVRIEVKPQPLEKKTDNAGNIPSNNPQ